MITFVNRKMVKPTMVRGESVWGWTYRKAGFVEAGETKGGLLALQLHPSDMPAAAMALPNASQRQRAARRLLCRLNQNNMRTDFANHLQTVRSTYRPVIDFIEIIGAP